MAGSAGLLNPVPPSAYSISSIVIGRKNVGAAVVARAASQTLAGNADAKGKLLYDRIKTGVPAARVLVATTKVLQALESGFSKHSCGSRLLSRNTFCTSCSM